MAGLSDGGANRFDVEALMVYVMGFSTLISSVHGEKPSAAYAKSRKESLESEFGHMLTSSSKSSSMFYRFGPFLALYRAAIISFHALQLTISHFFVHDIRKRSIKGSAGCRDVVMAVGEQSLMVGDAGGYVEDDGAACDGGSDGDGAFRAIFVLSSLLLFCLHQPTMVLGQALSTRPDILPTEYCQELAKLQDQIPSFSTRVAINSIESQLGVPISQIFADISLEPIAAASLGQVYKAHLHSGELVAVKVQRPGMSVSLTLDALLFQMIGGQLKRFAKARKDLLVAVNEMVSLLPVINFLPI
ncbi:hypothetical protein RJ640_019330 [Escallonia rubra]|uniref:ABC1 atypical kinase-like domain-containing protein n=1 Tax=Escallonia rubra TaxID=112253 RepID=A0AA88QES8_9ASTE|nr:hypothetical protein RJ640_019330 [Escallonia rubra]